MSEQAKTGDRVTVGDGHDHWLVMGPGDCPSRYHLMRHDFHIMAFINDLRPVRVPATEQTDE